VQSRRVMEHGGVGARGGDEHEQDPEQDRPHRNAVGLEPWALVTAGGRAAGGPARLKGELALGAAAADRDRPSPRSRREGRGGIGDDRLGTRMREAVAAGGSSASERGDCGAMNATGAVSSCNERGESPSSEIDRGESGMLATGRGRGGAGSATRGPDTRRRRAGSQLPSTPKSTRARLRTGRSGAIETPSWRIHTSSFSGLRG
jgi:hypothetical protein